MGGGDGLNPGLSPKVQKSGALMSESRRWMSWLKQGGKFDLSLFLFCLFVLFHSGWMMPAHIGELDLLYSVLFK